MQRFIHSKIKLALGLLFMLVIGGILGYKIISEYSWIDAIYMTVITITTVGFGEINPPTPTEKVFTTILIISSIIIVSYALSVITEYIVSRTSIKDLKNKRMQQKIDDLKDHVIVCGYGRNGREAVDKLKSYKQDFMIIEINQDIIDADEHGFLFISGNANEDEILLKAGIEKAKTLICAMPEDADNLFTVLSARQLNKELIIISRASEETSVKKLKLAGADNVVLPDKIGGSHMASLVVVPDLVEFLDNLAVSGRKDSINVEQIPFEKVCSDGIEKTIAETDIRKKTGCSIIGYKGPEGEYIVNPEANTKLIKGSKIIVIGRPDQITVLKTEFGI
ncbi:potassium channel family protein [Christiangramia antarctica]|nr:potassium channel protein [Gramella sp. AN32]MCM4154656.1 potassium channel protein [Gramella sp. AN32]